MSKDRDDYALASNLYDRFLPDSPTNPAALVDVDIAGQMRMANNGIVVSGYDHAATSNDGSPNLLSNVHINRLHRFVEQIEYMLAGLRRQIFAHKIRTATYPPQMAALNPKLTFIEPFYSTQFCDDEADACVFNGGWGLPDDNQLVHDALGMRLWNSGVSVNVSYRTKDLLDSSYDTPLNSHLYEPNKQTGYPRTISDGDEIYVYADGNKEFWQNAHNKIKLQVGTEEELEFDSTTAIGDFMRHWKEAPAYSTGGGESLIATVTLTPEAILHCFAIYVV